VFDVVFDACCVECKENVMKRYDKLIRNPSEREAEILSFWDEHDTFAKTLEATKGGPRYVFFEGPPTANGKPHFGHLMPRVYKDLFPRFQTMRGRYVARKAGWDTHGLPVELEIEKAIGVNSKPEIEEYGVAKFVEKCKESVWKYKVDWEVMMKRMGFWIDFEDAYVTYTDGYIETVWWELNKMFERGLLYQGHKTLPYCPRCGTGLSSHEVAQGYKKVEDPTVMLRLPVVNDEKSTYKLSPGVRTSVLTWTTTPWTLPANVAAAVAADAIYVEVLQGGERFVLGKALVEKTLKGDFEVLREFTGADLVGLQYEPPYDLLSDPKAHRVYAADFVNMEDGTGTVHIASAFGEDDYQLGQEVGLPFLQPVDLAGKFTDEFPMGAGEFVKDVDERIIEDLTTRGLLYRSVPYEHDYPFCWRCDTPLLYYARDSWYIRTTDVKDELIANNASINWHPSHVGEGRLAGFLANLRDWALSRDRYWGTPLNLWVCSECEKTTSVGSREDMVKRAVNPELAKTVELHRPYVDEVQLVCEACGGKADRVPYVIDTWFDSGSMHSAQWHYPFENEDLFKENFPADFICEAMEQTRGWFYTLLATSTIIHGVAPFKNCMGTGLGLDENGLKMSKSKGNVTDPWDAIEAYGSDCLRWYLYSSSAPWKSKRLGDADIKEPLYRFLDTIRNSYDFFALYASIDGFDPEAHHVNESDKSVLDRWILSRLASTVQTVNDSLDAYDVITSTTAIESLVSDLSNWYVRLSRRRFWRGGMGPDKIAAYATMREVLVEASKLMAPFIPFLSEAVYRLLRTADSKESVHLCSYPVPQSDRVDAQLERDMSKVRQIVALGHQARNQAQIKVRQPLARAVIEGKTDEPLSEDLVQLIRTELNVEAVEALTALDEMFEEMPAPNFRTLGPRLGSMGNKAGNWIRQQTATDVREWFASGSYTIELDGTSVKLLSEDITYDSAMPDHLVLSEEGGNRVLLDTTLDDRLRDKGWVRELTHRIQMARKNAEFEVTDRIAMTYSADTALKLLVEANREEIAEEILAVSVDETDSLSGEYSETIEFDGMSITVALTRTPEGNTTEEG
jgi:isoleucyl-tRNA synthetase